MSKGKYNALEKLAIIEEVSNGEIGFLAAEKKTKIRPLTTATRANGNITSSHTSHSG